MVDSVNFWINKFSIALDIELADKKNVEGLEFLSTGKFRYTQCFLKRRTTPQESNFKCDKILQENAQKSGTLNERGLPNFSQRF